jgi:hypothetical protein
MLTTSVGGGVAAVYDSVVPELRKFALILYSVMLSLCGGDYVISDLLAHFRRVCFHYRNAVSDINFNFVHLSKKRVREFFKMQIYVLIFLVTEMRIPGTGDSESPVTTSLLAQRLVFRMIDGAETVSGGVPALFEPEAQQRRDALSFQRK